MSLTKTSYSMISGAVFNVLDYGADSTGSADSTSAIQAAITAAGLMVFDTTLAKLCVYSGSAWQTITSV